MIYKEWLDSIEGYHAASSIYLALATMRPSKFEIDQKLREAYNDYLRSQDAHKEIS